MRLIILLLLVGSSVFSQDTIFFADSIDAVTFLDTNDYIAGYPRQNTITYQDSDIDTLISEYYIIINKVNTRIFPTPDSVWRIGIYVLRGDVYFNNSTAYQCIKTHKSKDNNEPPNTKYWMLYAPVAQPWVLDENVVYGDIRIYELVEYKCIKAHKTKESNKPPDSKYWEIN